MAIKEIDPQAAYDLLKAGSSCVYIDVRTVPEFESGHPDGAVNIPIALPDPGHGMAMNDQFTQVVEAHYPKETTILVGCQAGSRSTAAARLLDEAGYPDVSNVHGGFGGMRDPSGQVIAPGWSNLGLPVSQENGANVSYTSLVSNIK